VFLQPLDNQQVINYKIPNPFLERQVGNFVFCNHLIVSRIRIDRCQTPVSRVPSADLPSPGLPAYRLPPPKPPPEKPPPPPKEVWPPVPLTLPAWYLLTARVIAAEVMELFSRMVRIIVVGSTPAD